ncbi:hypothetical protein [Ktedonobacter racemifer]|uniref:3-keto-disaccharide hydrolase domain-containing protein n=1 Tax=Ktedonobacter racemifer DSM 44963 TaxID=485913 RepID=D6THV8_KTERA|nr:hypothetical protein [Ktedonobacter racemifer]EFH90928.1 hypothetical protein Krac_12570 [Ktedonobacter racemifer DSM 44963]
MQCRSCQAEIPQGATVCPSCQAPVKVTPAPSEYVAFPDVPSETPAGVIPPQGPNAPMPTAPSQGPIVMPPYPPYPHYAPMPFPPPQPKKKRKTWLIVTLSILVVVILGSCGFICSLGVLGMQGIMMQAQKQTQSIQATVSTQATQSVNAQALYTEVTNNTPTFSNSLASKGEGDWIDIGSDSTYSCGFKNGTYHVSISKKGYITNCDFNRFYMNFAIQVEVNLLKGDYSGLIFRADSTGNKYYMFEYNQQGEYSLLKRTDTTGNIDSLTWGMATPYLNNKYGQKNVVTIIARGPSIYLYVNQHFLSQVQDETYTSGYTGLLADDTNKPTEVAFSNVKVWEI